MYLRTFGQVELATARLAPRQLLLIAYLAAEGSVSRARLRSLMWPTSSTAAASLRVSLSTLRQVVPGLIIEQGDRLTLECGNDISDLLCHIRAGRPTHALELYRGPFLSDLSPSLFGAELEEWLIDTRETIAEQLWESLVHTAEHMSGTGRVEESTVLAEAAWQLPGLLPRDEHGLKRLHRLLLLGGSTFTGLVAREAREIGVEVLTSQPPVVLKLERTLPFGANLPIEVTPFVGHRESLSWLGQSLADPEIRLLTIFGTGGAGKSRLAMQVAQRAQFDYPERVWWVSLEDLHEPEALLLHTATCLGLQVIPGQSALDVVSGALKKQPTLVVFDQFEHLQGAAPQVAELLTHCPNLKVIVTSRHRLSLRAEVVFELGGLSVVTSAGQDYSDALLMFLQHARRVRPAYQFTVDDLRYAQELCEIVGGIPLAIELAANWMRILSPQQMIQELKVSLDILNTKLADLPERHQNLQVVLDQSWQHLSSREQETLVKLLVFQGGFTLESAINVTGATLYDLQALTDKSMLRVNAMGRFSRHPLISELSRHYVNTTISREAQISLEMRHVEFFLERSGIAFQDLLDGNQSVKWRSWFTLEYPNLLIALEKAITHGDSVSAAYLCRNLHREWVNRDQAGTALATLLSLLPDLEGTEHQDVRIWTKMTAESLALYSGVESVVDGLAAAKEAQNDYAIMCALYVREQSVQPGTPEHEAVLHELIEAATRIGRPGPLALTLIRRASAAMTKGQCASAVADLNQVLTLIKPLGTSYIQAEAQMLLGGIHALQGNLDQASESFEAALQVFSVLSFWPDASTCLNGMAMTILFGAQPATLNDDLQHALDLCQIAEDVFDIEGRFAVRDSSNIRGFVLLAMNHTAEAQACFERDLRAAKRWRNKHGEFVARLGIGRVALNRRDWATAKLVFASIFDDTQASGTYMPIKWLASLGLAESYSRLGEVRTAYAYRSVAIDVEQSLNIIVPNFLK